MRKRIALLVIGFVVVLGAFFLYQVLTGASFLSSRKAPPTTTMANGEEHSPTYEQRAPNGDLLYLLSAKKAAPLKDEGGNPLPGQYDLTEPRATYYTSDGNLLYIRSDKGTVTINDRGVGGSGSAGGAGAGGGGAAHSSGINDHFRGAHLSGHVILTYGPRESFTDASTDIKAGQYQVRFEKDLDLNYAESLVTSPGRVHLRADQDKMRFDGENLTIAFSRTEKKQQIELLRIEPTTGQDNYMLIRDVGKNGGLSLDNATGRGGNAAAVQNPPPATATPPAAATAAVTEQAATQDAGKSKGIPPTTYKVSFGKDVTANLGKSTLTCAQLYVFFQANAPQSGKATPKPGDPAAPADAGPATGPAPVAQPVAARAAPKQAAPEDLEVRWTGPMEMRPSAPDDIQLADRRDEAIEALGTPQRPVLVHDETRTARAGILKYRKGTQDIELEPGSVGPVVVTDADPADPVHAVQRLTCLGLHFSNADNRVHLEPGHLEVPQSVLRHDVHATGEPLTMSWEKTLDVDLVKIPTAKAGVAKENYTARRAVFAGRSSITNVDFHLESDALDILLAPGKGTGTGGAAKSTPVLEHLLATGNVKVKGASRTGAGIKDADNPDGINADRLELTTAIGPGGPVPARLLAEGNVMAWGYQVEEGTGGGAKKGSLSKNTLYTPRFDAALAPKTRGNEKGDGSALGRVDVTSFMASDGVIVQIDSANSPTVYAKGKTLTAQVDQANKAAKAVLDGEQLADGTQQYAEVSQGERGDNKISGLRILLDEKDRAIDIPGPGTFNFVQAAQKPGQKPMPAQVTWTKSMHFDNKTLLAHFEGDIDAHLVDQTDQISKLTCHKVFDVQLTKDPAAAAGNPTALGHLHLGKVYASGNVTAQGTKLDAAGKLISGIFLTKTEALTYDETSKNLDIPGPGQLLLQDYTVDKAPKANNNSDSRGDTLFTWDGSLTYNGPSGMIAFSKNVYMNHHPLKPIKVDEAEAPKKAGAAAAPPADQHIILTADSLVAKVSQSKGPDAGPTSASPLALGAGSRQTLDNVIARGHAILSMGEEKLSAETLTFNKVTNIATATGSDIDHPAEIFRPGEGITTAASLKWDLTKGKNAIEVTGGHGTVQQN